MLPAPARLTRREDFRLVVRRGVRAGRRTVVVHVLTGQRSGPRVGFVVSGAVGRSVVRNRVLRRLRHAVAARLTVLPRDAMLVVRALAPAAGASTTELAADLESAFRGIGVLAGAAG